MLRGDAKQLVRECIEDAPDVCPNYGFSLEAAAQMLLIARIGETPAKTIVHFKSDGTIDMRADSPELPEASR